MPPQQRTGAAEETVGETTPTITDHADILAALDRLAAALADERAAFEEGFRLGYGDGYEIGHAHGEQSADTVWSWALGAIGVGKREPNPDRRAANRWRLLAGHGPKGQEAGR